ncbi:MAG: hypothetical protein M2R45_05282 [Verrucomicrobia subdivision 3 bacterium]|nr:hypothetical protein [Limisphaerales bacterium]MCS1417480.1 hypothetical protein [Limisphaerales bacterium]
MGSYGVDCSITRTPLPSRADHFQNDLTETKVHYYEGHGLDVAVEYGWRYLHNINRWIWILLDWYFVDVYIPHRPRVIDTRPLRSEKTVAHDLLVSEA